HLSLPGTVCYQMDRYQADRLKSLLSESRIELASDLWDVPGSFATVLYPSPPRGERALKLDMLEQAFHVLQPNGEFVVLSPIARDSFFPAAVKKVFKKSTVVSGPTGTVVTAKRTGDRPRRRHEQTFTVRITEGRIATFISRPGVFAYGRMDDG